MHAIGEHVYNNNVWTRLEYFSLNFIRARLHFTFNWLAIGLQIEYWIQIEYTIYIYIYIYIQEITRIVDHNKQTYVQVNQMHSCITVGVIRVFRANIGLLFIYNSSRVICVDNYSNIVIGVSIFRRRYLHGSVAVWYIHYAHKMQVNSFHCNEIGFPGTG